jgi:hypothetical protein
MSNPEDPLRPNRVDPNAMFAALDRVVAETPIGIPHTGLEPPAATEPTETVDSLFPERETEPEPVGAAAVAAPQPEPVIETHIVDPHVVERQVVETTRTATPAPNRRPQPDPEVVAAHFAPPTVVEEFEPEGEPIVLPREDQPWSAWQERRRKAQPEAVPEPMTRARTFSPAPAAAPELPPPVVDEEPAQRASSHGFFATVADVVDNEPAKPESSSSLKMIWTAVALLALLVIVEGIYIASSRGTSAPAAATAPVAAAATNVGTVHIESTPPGATVLLNGQDRGATPATLLLAAGDYQLELVRGAQRQLLPVKVKAGSEGVYQVVLSGTADVGEIRVASDPAGVAVAIDGTRRGITPLTVSQIPAGGHTVTVFGPSGSIQNKVEVAAGGVAAVAVTLSAAKPVATGGTTAVGYVSVEAPMEMQLLENGKLVGTSRMDRIILPAGAHDIEAVNEALGYSSMQRVMVTADTATKVQFEVPTAKVSVNAIPWADVTIDGKSVGQTPIGNLAVAIGSHEIVYKHPQLGEQRQTITVTVSGPNRFSAAMRK